MEHILFPLSVMICGSSSWVYFEKSCFFWFLMTCLKKVSYVAPVIDHFTKSLIDNHVLWSNTGNALYSKLKKKQMNEFNLIIFLVRQKWKILKITINPLVDKLTRKVITFQCQLSNVFCCKKQKNFSRNTTRQTWYPILTVLYHILWKMAIWGGKSDSKKLVAHKLAASLQHLVVKSQTSG